MARKQRDDFPLRVKETLAKRAGYKCSNPACQAPTVGPQKQDDAGTVNVGRAAHITAAAAGGPRYDVSLTPEERRAQSNGLWCCAVCGDLVDKDEQGFSVALLRQWKKDAEARARTRLGKSKGRSVDPYRGLALQVRRNLRIRDELKKAMLKPFDPDARGRDAKPYARFRPSKLIIHSLEDKTYPNVEPTPPGVISGWFRVEPYDFYPGGLKVLLWLYPGIIDGNGNWRLINSDREKVDLQKYRSVTIWIVGKIPWENIGHYDFRSDGYYSAHIYCAFANNGEPYEAVEHYLDGNEHEWPHRLDPAREIPAPDESVE